jgi:hypothetical protein
MMSFDVLFRGPTEKDDVFFADSGAIRAVDGRAFLTDLHVG